MSRYTQYFSQNNVSSELAVWISSIATTIQVNEDQGNLRWNKFPVLWTLENFNSDGSVAKREIVKVVSRTWDAFNVVRAFAPCPLKDWDTTQAQVASTFSAWDKFSIYIPAEILEAVSDAINDLYNNWNDRLFLKKTAWLWFEITPWNVRFETGEAYYPWGTWVVVDNSMNYIMLDSSFNIIVNQEELFDVQNISIAEVKAVNGEITEITTRKIDWIAWRMGWGWDPVYWDWSDGDLVISENTILNAGQQYQFSNLTICPWAVVSFSWNGWAKIKVANLFINEWTIDTTDLDVDAHEYRDSTSFCMICNCAFYWINEPWKWWCWWIDRAWSYHWWDWWNAIETPNWYSNCVWAWWSCWRRAAWNPWSRWFCCWWWWWWWWTQAWTCTSVSCYICMTSWCPWNWLNWWDWWRWWYDNYYTSNFALWWWWGWWWWYYTWKWWKGWDSFWIPCRPSTTCFAECYQANYWKIRKWWNWWNWWILWNWWAWWNIIDCCVALRSQHIDFELLDYDILQIDEIDEIEFVDENDEVDEMADEVVFN